MAFPGLSGGGEGGMAKLNGGFRRPRSFRTLTWGSFRYDFRAASPLLPVTGS